MNIYAYAYARDRENEMEILYYDIYLEKGDNDPLWLYARPLARSVFRFYYGSYFDDGNDYIILVDYEHGGHGGGSEFFTVIDSENYSIVPTKLLPPYDYQLTDSNDAIIVTLDRWMFEIPLDELILSHKTGDIVIIEDDRLVRYSYYSPSILFDEHRTDGQLTLCLRAEYILLEREICINSLTLVGDEKYFLPFWDGVYR
jgi:hypothetical protein